MRASLLALAALFAAPSAPLAQTQPSAPLPPPPPCAAAYGPRVCGSAALAPLRAELHAKFMQVIATGNRTATWQARQAEALREIRTARDYDGKPIDDDALAQRFRDFIEQLDAALSQAKGVRDYVKTPSARGETCMASWLNQGCRVTASGILWDKSGRSVYWQMMEGASARDGVGAGIVLWAGSGYGTARLIGFSFDGVVYEPPRITQGGLIWVPGRRAGTGEGNADLLYRWDDGAGAWQDIELESWRDGLDARLPKGFGIWKGIDYDFEGMGGFSKLWRDKDGNCCPSGGDATLNFEIRGRSLALTEVRTDIVARWAR
ncbi:hypothetical protein [Sphingomonas sp.]|uniref:hypothetical protein n=1 Tax=Sphingomonas sp. TaxID=28214 RepID=UPI001EB79B4F|nr:hypothetical protein [Sphingomonas sp.]MBX3594378.1 hypothetical protein [Sphingomonas sp.]